MMGANIRRYEFYEFLQPNNPISLSGPFRDNIRRFIGVCFESLDSKIKQMAIWRIILAKDGTNFPLYIFEDLVEKSEDPFCLSCQGSGSSNQFVSKRKYHFVIPTADEWNQPLDEDILESETLILHGLIHCNGLGHLLILNGIAGGSRYIHGKIIMDLWDHICSTLHARKITVVDTCRKGKIDLRLLYGLSYHQSWFGLHWNYSFGHGSFGLTRQNYDEAIQTLSNLRMDEIFDTLDLKSKKIVLRYRKSREAELVTLGNLFRFMIEFRAENGSPSIKGVYQNMEDLYVRILSESDSAQVRRAVTTVRKCKIFVKEWAFQPGSDGRHTRLICRLIPMGPPEMDLATVLYRGNTVTERLVIKANATLSELKKAIETAFRDTYIIMANLIVLDVVGLEGVDDESGLLGTLDGTLDVSARVAGLDLSTNMMYEGGRENWRVNCVCGARDDDGELMVICDRCKVWQHTECCGIQASVEEDVPPFTCQGCLAL